MYHFLDIYGYCCTSDGVTGMVYDWLFFFFYLWNSVNEFSVIRVRPEWVYELCLHNLECMAGRPGENV